MVSHSTGIIPLLKHFGSDERIKKGCYCCAIGVDLEKDSEGVVKVKELKVI